jgi:uncharacterized protein (UPF0333 family)
MSRLRFAAFVLFVLLAGGYFLFAQEDSAASAVSAVNMEEKIFTVSGHTDNRSFFAFYRPA